MTISISWWMMDGRGRTEGEGKGNKIKMEVSLRPAKIKGRIHALYGLLHFVRERTADDENFLHSSKSKTFERPV